MMMTFLLSNNTAPYISNATLLAQEENVPPIGLSVASNRPIGFASVFLNIRNPIDAKQSLTIRSVEIVNLNSQQVELRLDDDRRVRLMPLEHTTVDIHLTNQTGYSEIAAIQAIITYEAGGQVHVVKSPAATILH